MVFYFNPWRIHIETHVYILLPLEDRIDRLASCSVLSFEVESLPRAIRTPPRDPLKGSVYCIRIAAQLLQTRVSAEVDPWTAKA